MERKKEIILVIVVAGLLFGVKVLLSTQQTGIVSQNGPLVAGRLGMKGAGTGSQRKQGDTPSLQGDSVTLTSANLSRLATQSHGKPSMTDTINTTRVQQLDHLNTKSKNSERHSRYYTSTVLHPAANDVSLDKMRIVPRIFTSQQRNYRHLPETVYRYAPQIFDGVPQEFLPEFKNPCWWAGRGDGGGDAALRCLPYFFLAGMPKSGTTDVHQKLLRHPEIFESTIKEPHWWTRERFRGKDLDVYIDEQSVNLVPNLMNGGNPNNIIGDSSASTFWDIHYSWSKVFAGMPTGTPHYVADVISTVLPKAKIIVVLRNPIDRLYSDYKYFSKGSPNPSEFHRNVVRFVEIFDSCLSRTRDLRACVYDRQVLKAGRANIGMYSTYYRDWLKAFPRDKIKVLRLEDWRANCTQLLRELFEFLNLSKVGDAMEVRICSIHLANVGNRTVPSMLPETRQLLRKLYRPMNNDLAHMMQDDRYLWEDRP